MSRIVFGSPEARAIRNADLLAEAEEKRIQAEIDEIEGDTKQDKIDGLQFEITCWEDEIRELEDNIATNMKKIRILRGLPGAPVPSVDLSKLIAGAAGNG